MKKSKKYIIVITIILIYIYGRYLDQILFGPNFCTTKLRYFDLEYFENKVDKMYNEGLKNSRIILNDTSNGWDSKVLYTKERFGGFSSLATHSYMWTYTTEDGGMGFPCLSMNTCGKIWLNGDSGECGWLEGQLKKN